jgi:cobalt-zinc-cadmium efflux system protein
MGHEHDHAGHDHLYTGRVLKISLGITIAYIVVLVVAGLRAHSLALLSEAAHNVSDLLALVLSLLAVYFQSRPANPTKTFGYGRASVLAAFVNSIALVGLSFYLLYEAAARLREPVPVRPGLMIGVAVAGVAVNGIITLLVWRSGRSDLNLRSVLLHEVGDTLSTAAVVVGGWAILLTGQQWIDPALSFGIGALILWSSFGIIRVTLNILLEGTPAGLDAEQICQSMLQVEGVKNVHDLHVWSIGSCTHALSCHMQIADIPPSESQRILREVQQSVSERFHINHTTIQFEHIACEFARGCVIPISQAHHHEHQHSHPH